MDYYKVYFVCFLLGKELIMKYVLLGDSITEGIGSRRLNYVNQLANITANQHQFINLAKTGTTVKYFQFICKEIYSEKPDGLIIMYGSVDAQIRANVARNRFGICNLIPHRYKIGGMLEQRAFYSKKWYRIIPDCFDNLFRKVLKKVILLTQGSVQCIDISTFQNRYEGFISDLPNLYHKILVSTVYIDDKYFLRSSAEYEKFNAVIRDISTRYNCKYVDLYFPLKKSVEQFGWEKYYSCDHFHPNVEGYKFIAELIGKYI